MHCRFLSSFFRNIGIGAELVGLVGLCLTSCLDHELGPGDELADAPFIAFQRDFEGFQYWPSFDLRTTKHAGIDGMVRLYINEIVPPGSTTFPTGTILIKTVEAGNRDIWVAHAMVKRGGAYNQNGAFNWEFFDLALSTPGKPAIIWRGENPPSDHGYESLPGMTEGTDIDCNRCHTSQRNDAVLSDVLQLGQIQ